MMSHLLNHFPVKPKIVFMGTPDFSVPTLKALVKHEHFIQSVVTQPDRPKGRGKKLTASAVKRWAVEHGIEVLQPQRVSDDAFCNRIKEQGLDLIIVVAFGQILRKKLLSIPAWGAINIHASLLPKYRGAAPIQWALINNESVTGLSVMQMDEGMDTGPILFQEEVPIQENETAGGLHDRLAHKAGDLIIQALKKMAEGAFELMPQDHTKASYAPKITKDMTLIDWNSDADHISCLIRALDPMPGAYTVIGLKPVKLFSSRVSAESRVDLVPGRVQNNREKGLMVETGKGILEIREVQYPGKKRIPSQEFLRGFSLPPGIVLGQ
jgi:methionyl-tRNA formyltransferase